MEDISKFFRRCKDGRKLERYAEATSSDNFKNIVEFGGLRQTSPTTLRAVKDITCTMDPHSDSVDGDFCNGFILAADELHKRTKGKKYNRKIVLITDGEHAVENPNSSQLQAAIQSMRELRSELVVLGIGFRENKDFAMNEIVKADGESEEESEDDDGSEDDDSEGEEDENRKPDAVESGNPDDGIVTSKPSKRDLMRSENERLLQSIVGAVGGCILAADGCDISDLLMTRLPPKAGTKKSVAGNADIRIAPGLTLEGKQAVLTSKVGIKPLIKEKYSYDPETGDPERDSAGELMTLKTRIQRMLVEDKDSAVEVPIGEHSWRETVHSTSHRRHPPSPSAKRTNAYRYGSDLVPVGKMDEDGLKAPFFSDKKLTEVMGYLDKNDVVNSNLLAGPTYAIFGGDKSVRGRTAIAALSQALEETDKVAFCKLKKEKKSEPIVG